MRPIFFFLLIILSLPVRVLPQAANRQASSPGKTYAVVVGISSYENNGITRLDFAHRDAEEFNRFLRSPSGGNVPEENIRLLLNNQASYMAIYNALYWLLETCNKDDLVYFYFSGHGDVENNTIYKRGFLLAANTPKSNYMFNALRIEDLNTIANTLSAEKGARVILITDACHSGKLAGNENRGKFLVGEQLRAVEGKEIRITSCGPDQLSNEDERWGGGRGVFSYYLIKGLEGLADYSKDKTVTVDEIRNYLSNALVADKVLADKEHKQTPVVNGKDNLRLAVVDPARLTVVQQAVRPPDAEAGDVSADLQPLGISPQGYLFSLARGQNIEELVDFNQLNRLPAEQIPFSFIRMLVAATRDKVKMPDTVSIQRLEKSLRENKDALKRFNEKFTELLADRGQAIINLYLDGDEAELERRRYYNSRSSGYDVYTKMFDIAVKLLSAQNPLHQVLKVKYHYFAGVAARLKIPLEDNADKLLDTAMREQLAALKLLENAAYIHNELGILYRYKKDYVTSEKHFLRATQIAPSWALPWSNLAGLYAVTNRYDEGVMTVEKARQLQPDFQGAFINSGLLFEKKGNLLLAEEYYRKSIRMNSRHYLPFERLGYVCMKTTRYADADSNFLEADKRKRGYKFEFRDSDMQGVVDQFDVEPPIIPCNFDTSTVRKEDVIGNFYIGLLYVGGRQFDKAEYKFKQVISTDPSNPLAFHHLGKLLYDQQRWKEADIILNYAVQYHLDAGMFGRYCDSLKKLYPQYDREKNSGGIAGKYSCVLDMFMASWVQKKETRFFLGTAFEKWNHFEEAEQQFRAIIKDDDHETGAYYKLWNLLENTGRYYDAEAVIRSYPEKIIHNHELFALYRRIISRHPERGEWPYKAGALMYDVVSGDPEKYPDDRKKLVIDSDKDDYIKGSFYEQQNFVSYKVPGTGEEYMLHQQVPFPITEGILYLRKADSLLAQDEILAEINYKLGDLYVWQGLPERADRFYKKSVTIKPDNANVRTKYINTSIINYNYGIALEQLDSLYSRKEINYPNQLLMAEYCMYAGRFADAASLLKEAREIHPYRQDNITDLNGRLQLLSGKPLPAITYYKEYLANNPGDVNTMYSIAKMYAVAKNSNEAWKWLTQALNKGFNYYWVLKYDESWNSYRSSPRWAQLTRSVKPKE